MDITMDNQQETEKAWIAGIMDGEGCFAIYKSLKIFRGDISISNTNHAILNRFVKFLKNNGIAFYMRTYKKKAGRKYLYHIQITKMESRKRFIDLIEPYITKKELLIIREFIKRKMELISEGRKRNEVNGRFDKGRQNTDGVLQNIYERYKAFKDSSETLCQSPISVG